MKPAELLGDLQCQVPVKAYMESVFHASH